MGNNRNTTKTLEDQHEKVWKHIHGCSIATRRDYKSASHRFIEFIGENYGVEKLKNIDSRHLDAYADHMTKKDLSPSTIKKELSAIRYFHDHISGAKHRLPSNDELNVKLEDRMFSGIDRAWSQDEFICMVSVMVSLGFIDYACACALARYVGMRAREVFGLNRATVEKAVKTGEITFKGKGGLVRTVPLCPEAKEALAYMLNRTARGHKLFVPDGMDTHIARGKLQAFIRKHRHEVLDPGDTRDLTFHGLRHRFAADAFDYYCDKGDDKLSARLKVARLIGHNREDITNRYITSAKNKGGKA